MQIGAIIPVGGGGDAPLSLRPDVVAARSMGPVGNDIRAAKVLGFDYAIVVSPAGRSTAQGDTGRVLSWEECRAAGYGYLADTFGATIAPIVASGFPVWSYRAPLVDAGTDRAQVAPEDAARCHLIFDASTEVPQTETLRSRTTKLKKLPLVFGSPQEYRMIGGESLPRIEFRACLAYMDVIHADTRRDDKGDTRLDVAYRFHDDYVTLKDIGVAGRVMELAVYRDKVAERLEEARGWAAWSRRDGRLQWSKSFRLAMYAFGLTAADVASVKGAA